MGPYGEGVSVVAMLEQWALEALRWHWGEAYEITVTGGLWQARRLDGLGGAIEAATAEELRRLILDDYLTRPVPRTVAPGHLVTPRKDTVYSAGPRRAGRPADPGQEGHYPLTAVCEGCQEAIVRGLPEGEWQHRKD